jgi:hypothetical protein
MAAVYFITVGPKYVSLGKLYVQKESLLASLNSAHSSDLSWWVTPAQNAANQINELLSTDAFVRAVISQTDLEEIMSQDSSAIDLLFDETSDSIRIKPLGENQIEIYAGHVAPEFALQLANAAENEEVIAVLEPTAALTAPEINLSLEAQEPNAGEDHREQTGQAG